MTQSYSLDWAYAYDKPLATGVFRRTPEDFYVDEQLGFDLSGLGEHVYLHIEKRGDNTAWLARQIAQLAGVGGNDVGYAGLKDRHAVTRQWFSVYLPKGAEPDWRELESDTARVLAVTRHTQKLRRGAHTANYFCIQLHELTGSLDDLNQRLAQVAKDGVPNYFGAQRFGHHGNNLVEAQRLLVDGVRIKNRQQRGLMLSAARSYLFNNVLSARVVDGSWMAPMEGDITVNQGGSGPLWGRGRPLSSGACADLEAQVLHDLSAWCDGLEHVGLSQERRALSLLPIDFSSEITGDSLKLSFALPPGTFATSVLREISLLKEMSRPEGMV